ncbi:DNA binding domain-containing protein, excisionase family [Parafrankia irregularis]|uniref:DNA binding domain-containing protein, excisionase family n=2 Tax=Frankiaceae TaxID=74712 RepID=A0A0S4QRQ7_9ACTN|nr:helix-turn-helix domain-containing protein [Parafrankia irregularis]MBE3202639.1 helix-turn-helix domain-containing protein [Parafrankia sp. CH37]CUU57823.1 DNA binding domain-containing protein, excisionase family [Parafrankia irregularis]
MPALASSAVASTSGGHTEPLLTLDEVCSELRITRSTFYDWRLKGLAPKCITLPSRKVRVERSELEAWKAALRDAE